jgi:hypothetical protein
VLLGEHSPARAMMYDGAGRTVQSDQFKSTSVPLIRSHWRGEGDGTLNILNLWALT